MKKLSRALLYCFLWALFALLLVSWLFDLRTDPAPEKQIVLCADGCPADTAAFEKRLLPEMPEGIEYIRVRMLSYAFFDTETGLPTADLYILPDSEAAEYAGILITVGPLYDAETGTGRLGAYFTFGEGGAAGENYMLYCRDRGLGEAHMQAVLALAARIMAL